MQLARLSQESPIAEPVVKDIRLSNVLSNFNKALSEINRHNHFLLTENKVKVLFSMRSEDVKGLCSVFMKLYPHWFDLPKLKDIMLSQMPDDEAARELVLKCFKLQGRSNGHEHGWEHYGSCLKSSCAEIILGSPKERDPITAPKTIARTKYKGPSPKCIIHPNKVGRKKDTLCNNCTMKLRKLGLADHPLDEALVKVLSHFGTSIKLLDFCINHPDRLAGDNFLCAECNKDVDKVLKQIEQDKEKVADILEHAEKAPFNLLNIESKKIHGVRNIYQVGKLVFYSTSCGHRFTSTKGSFKPVDADTEITCGQCLKFPRTHSKEMVEDRMIENIDKLEMLINQLDYLPIGVSS